MNFEAGRRHEIPAHPFTYLHRGHRPVAVHVAVQSLLEIVLRLGPSGGGNAEGDPDGGAVPAGRVAMQVRLEVMGGILVDLVERHDDLTVDVVWRAVSAGRSAGADDDRAEEAGGEVLLFMDMGVVHPENRTAVTR